MYHAWDAAQNLVALAVALSHPREACLVLVFRVLPISFEVAVSDRCPRRSLIAVCMAVEAPSPESLRFLGGVYRNSQLRWPTVDKETFGIMSRFPVLEYLL